MPKYKPTEQDLYDTTPCPVCGEYILEEGAETCGSNMCRIQWKSFKEDYEQLMIDDFLENQEAG
jgi:hypothetical protein